jgi:transposase-like protein
MDTVILVIEQGYSITETSLRLGINRSNITRWLREHRDGLGKLPINSDSAQELQDEIKRLRKENKRL